MRIRKLITERFGKLNETKEYNYKGEATRDYFQGKITVKELVGMSNDLFHTDVTSKKELTGLLNNSFMQDLASQQYGIDKETLVSKAEELLNEI